VDNKLQINMVQNYVIIRMSSIKYKFIDSELQTS